MGGRQRVEAEDVDGAGLVPTPASTWVGTVVVETVGALLARVRLEQGVSQLRLAERLCAASGQATVTRHEVSRWEREERIPSRYWLRWLAAVLEVPLVELERAAAAARRARGQTADTASSSDLVPRPVPGYVRLAPGVFRRAS